jgi:hypothetical protein
MHPEDSLDFKTADIFPAVEIVFFIKAALQISRVCGICRTGERRVKNVVARVSNREFSLHIYNA